MEVPLAKRTKCDGPSVIDLTGTTCSGSSIAEAVAAQGMECRITDTDTNKTSASRKSDFLRAQLNTIKKLYSVYKVEHYALMEELHATHHTFASQGGQTLLLTEQQPGNARALDDAGAGSGSMEVGGSSQPQCAARSGRVHMRQALRAARLALAPQQQGEAAAAGASDAGDAARASQPPLAAQVQQPALPAAAPPAEGNAAQGDNRQQQAPPLRGAESWGGDSHVGSLHVGSLNAWMYVQQQGAPGNGGLPTPQSERQRAAITTCSTAGEAQQPAQQQDCAMVGAAAAAAALEGSDAGAAAGAAGAAAAAAGHHGSSGGEANGQAGAHEAATGATAAASGCAPHQRVCYGDDALGYGSDGDPCGFSDAEDVVLRHAATAQRRQQRHQAEGADAPAGAADPPAGAGPAADPATAAAGAASAEELAAWRSRFAAHLPQVVQLEAAAAAITEQDLEACGALACLVGRTGRHLIKRACVVVGRSTETKGPVDVDLSAEGPAHRVSRRQAFIQLQAPGHFELHCAGRRAMAVNGVPVAQFASVPLPHLSLVEVGGLRLVFMVNGAAVERVGRRTARLAA